MGALVYTSITSLDGYINDESGSFEWATPDDEVFEFANELERGVGTCLLGRRMYETMLYWETFDEPDAPAIATEFAATWRATDKVVYSRTLESVSSERTRLVREFDADEVRRMKAESAAVLTVNGPGLASAAFAAGLVDEVNLLVCPASVGGGTPALPRGQRHALELTGLRCFASGFVHLHYRVSG